MPITFSIDNARRRLTTVAEGRVTYPEIVAHLELERDRDGLPLPEFADATNATINLTVEEVRGVWKGIGRGDSRVQGCVQVERRDPSLEAD